MLGASLKVQRAALPSELDPQASAFHLSNVHTDCHFAESFVPRLPGIAGSSSSKAAPTHPALRSVGAASGLHPYGWVLGVGMGWVLC